MSIETHKLIGHIFIYCLINYQITEIYWTRIPFFCKDLSDQIVQIGKVRLCFHPIIGEFINGVNQWLPIEAEDVGGSQRTSASGSLCPRWHGMNIALAEVFSWETAKNYTAHEHPQCGITIYYYGIIHVEWFFPSSIWFFSTIEISW